MAKYDWIALEKEYILSDFKTVSGFLKYKNIGPTGNTNKQTKGWNDKRAEKEQKKGNKIIEKVIEKESEKKAIQIVNLKEIANELALKIKQSMTELDRYIIKNKTKIKNVEYDNKIAKPTKEVIEEKEIITDFISVIDRQGLKQLTSALKDISDIIPNKEEEDEQNNTFVDALNEKVGEIWDEEE